VIEQVPVPPPMIQAQKQHSFSQSCHKAPPPSQLSGAQIQMANNQSVNSWFIQRLKSILQGNSQSLLQSQNPLVITPQVVTGKKYDASRQETYQNNWEAPNPQQKWLDAKTASHNVRVSVANQPSQALTASQKQAQIVNQIGAGILNGDELSVLMNKRPQPSIDSESKMMKQQVGEEDQVRSKSIASQMPDVVNKINGFVDERVPRKQSSN